MLSVYLYLSAYVYMTLLSTMITHTHTYSQVTVENDLGHDISGNDWVSQDATELLCNVQWINNCHLYRQRGGRRWYNISVMY